MKKVIQIGAIMAASACAQAVVERTVDRIVSETKKYRKVQIDTIRCDLVQLPRPTWGGSGVVVTTTSDELSYIPGKDAKVYCLTEIK